MQLYAVTAWLVTVSHAVVPFPFQWSKFNAEYGPLSKDEVDIAREQAREMFHFGYENYLKHAFPADELDPIHCTGRGHDYGNP